ncbi:MAG: aminotransferase class III-fold pyridoxal phosphate-dependent enzyme [Rhizobiaceae bacterium]|nr:aminotransferase class III-fold pyridoxal phosphate-dependent enzyme [Rhizobiaceae bacterium]
MNRIDTQAEWIERAKAVLPAAGFGNFDPGIVIREGKGSRVWDENGNEYVDYLIGSGPMLLGHGNEEVEEAVLSQIPKGMTFFANNALGIELAEEICRAVPCAEQLRYVSTGGEADMYAMRLARAYTGREKILKFEGGYHGMSAEAQMSLAPSKLVNFPQAVPDSAGIPEAVRDSVWAAPFNDVDFLRSFMNEHGNDIAGIIVEPLQRIIPPAPGFLEAVREECDKYGVILIFDEVVTGFRFAYGGAQELYGVTPDVATLGKVIGGGFPLAAIVGREDIMRHFDKGAVGAENWLMQLGTLSGNPVASIAGLKTLEILRRPGTYEKLRQLGASLMNMFSDHLSKAGTAHQIVGDETLFDIVFTNKPVNNYRDVLNADATTNSKFNDVLRSNQVFKSPGKTYPSLALTEDDLSITENAISKAAQAISP